MRRLKGVEAMKGLFSVPESDPLTPLKGTYELVINGLTFEQGSDIDVEMVFHGQLYGLAGTDHARRDISVALLLAHRWRWLSVCWLLWALRC